MYLISMSYASQNDMEFSFNFCVIHDLPKSLCSCAEHEEKMTQPPPRKSLMEHIQTLSSKMAFDHNAVGLPSVAIASQVNNMGMGANGPSSGAPSGPSAGGPSAGGSSGPS